MEIKGKILALVLLLATASACMKTKLEESYNKQEDKIDSYLKSKMLVKRDSSWTDTLGFKLDTTALEDGGMKIDTSWTVEKHDTSWIDTLRVIRNGGANRIVLKEGEGEPLNRNGFVSFYYAGYTFTGSFNASGLFVTNHQATAEQAKWNLTDADNALYEINLADEKLIQGLKDGLYGVKAGEECEILFNGKYGFGNEVFGIIPANSALLYKIWVVGVAND